MWRVAYCCCCSEVSRGQKGGGELGGACLQGGVDWLAALRDKCGVGVDCGFGLAPSRSKGVCLVMLLGFSNIRRPVLGIPKW